MPEALQEILVFAGETLLIVLAIVFVMMVFFALIMKAKLQAKKDLTIEYLNDHFNDMKNAIKKNFLNKKELKLLNRKEKKLKKEKNKQKNKKDKDKDNKEKEEKQKVFVIDFEGDIKASKTPSLVEEINAILSVAQKNDEVIVRIESSGGMVHAYGFAASQLKRIKDHQIPLTVCVDKVAASGGYLMACVADKILSAPFAIVGSIGVLAHIPNFNRLLKKNYIDFEELTAGEYKKTISFLGEITPEGKKKFLEQMEETHVLFKKFINDNRSNIDINKVSTGEYWYGQQAIDLNLIDEIKTSDEYLMNKVNEAEVYSIKYNVNKSISDKIKENLSQMTHKIIYEPFNKAIF